MQITPAGRPMDPLFTFNLLDDDELKGKLENLPNDITVTFSKESFVSFLQHLKCNSKDFECPEISKSGGNIGRLRRLKNEWFFGFSHLPKDIQRRIVSYIKDKKTLKSLSLVNKTLRSYAADAYFSYVTELTLPPRPCPDTFGWKRVLDSLVEFDLTWPHRHTRGMKLLQIEVPPILEVDLDLDLDDNVEYTEDKEGDLRPRARLSENERIARERQETCKKLAELVRRELSRSGLEILRLNFGEGAPEFFNSLAPLRRGFATHLDLVTLDFDVGVLVYDPSQSYPAAAESEPKKDKKAKRKSVGFANDLTDPTSGREGGDEDGEPASGEGGVPTSAISQLFETILDLSSGTLRDLKLNRTVFTSSFARQLGKLALSMLVLHIANPKGPITNPIGSKFEIGKTWPTGLRYLSIQLGKSRPVWWEDRKPKFSISIKPKDRKADEEDSGFELLDIKFLRDMLEASSQTLGELKLEGGAICSLEKGGLPPREGNDWKPLEMKRFRSLDLIRTLHRSWAPGYGRSHLKWSPPGWTESSQPSSSLDLGPSLSKLLSHCPITQIDVGAKPDGLLPERATPLSQPSPSFFGSILEDRESEDGWKDLGTLMFDRKADKTFREVGRDIYSGLRAKGVDIQLALRW